jgi:uncharacterized membrane protein
MENVLAVNFSDDATGYEALSKLKELDSQGQVALAGAAVVVRGEGVKDEVDDTGYTGTATGGLVGLIIGVLGGPFGILPGGATGVLVGSLFDLDDADDTESILSDISRSARVGHTALLAEVSEQSPEVVDAAIQRLGGTAVHRSVEDVEAEIALRRMRSALRRRKRASDCTSSGRLK